MTRFVAFVFGLFLASALCPIPSIAAPNSGKADADSAQTEVSRLLSDAQAAELDGEVTRREALLREALVVDPDCEAAHWQLGQIKIDDKWQPIAEVQRQTAADPRYVKYPALRTEYGQSAEGHLALARWCKRQGLEQEANFHWAALLTFQANHEEALRELGKRWVEGHLLTAEQRDELHRERREARRASQKWSAKLAGWEWAISGSDAGDRMQAQSDIRSITDPYAILALEDATLDAVGNDERKLERSRTIGLAFVEALDAMEGRSVTNSLTRHAVFAPAGEVRLAAIDALKKRSFFAYVPQLVDALSMPIESSFSITTDKNGSVYYHHELFREGPVSNSLMESQLTVRQVDQKGIKTYIYRNRFREVRGVEERQESDASVAKKKARVASNSLARFGNAALRAEQQVAHANQTSHLLNQRVVAVLKQTTGQELGTEPTAWWEWWQNHNEYYVPEERPTYKESYVDSEEYYYRPLEEHYHPPMSCFAAGTLVWTKTGQRPIESLEIGELVLSQEVDSGEFCFQPIIGRTLRPPSQMLKLAYGDETLRTTLGHPMWVAGKGWRMAKEIEPGSILHTVAGPTIVDSVDTDGEEEAYNLVVANTNNYFVGETGVLVHDNTPRSATHAKVPGWIDED